MSSHYQVLLDCSKGIERENLNVEFIQIDASLMYSLFFILDYFFSFKFSFLFFFKKKKIRILKKKKIRIDSPDISEFIESNWNQKKIENPKIFNGTKFKLFQCFQGIKFFLEKSLFNSIKKNLM